MRRVCPAGEDLQKVAGVAVLRPGPRELRHEIRVLQAAQGRLEPRPRPRAKPEPLVLPDTGRPTPPPGADEVRFVLKGVELDGNTVFSDEELGVRWQTLLDSSDRGGG